MARVYRTGCEISLTSTNKHCPLTAAARPPNSVEVSRVYIAKCTIIDDIIVSVLNWIPIGRLAFSAYIQTLPNDQPTCDTGVSSTVDRHYGTVCRHSSCSHAGHKQVSWLTLSQLCRRLLISSDNDEYTIRRRCLRDSWCR